MSWVLGADIRISRYCLQYRIHIGLDIGEKPDIGGGNKGDIRNIGHDIGPDIEKNADIGSNFHDIGGGNKRVYTICIRYRVRYPQYRARYRDQKHDIVISYADIGFANIGLRSDIGSDIGSSSDICTDNFSFCQVLLPGTNTIIAMIMTAIAVGIERWTEMSCAIISTKILTFLQLLLRTFDPTPLSSKHS